MPSTAIRGFRYPAATDRVADGATAIQNLAQDVDDYLTNPRPRAHAYLAASFTGTAGAYTYAVPWTLGQVTAVAGAGPVPNGVSVGSPTSRLVIATTGLYRIGFQARITYPTGTAPAANANGMSAIMQRNGAGAMLADYAPPAASVTLASPTRLVHLNAGDYLTLNLTSAASGTATFEGGEGVTFASVELV